MKAFVDRLRVDNLLVALALAMFAYRFANRDLLPFINDHGYLLSAAQNEIKHGKWAMQSPIVGTQGLRYGPTPSWFYRVVQMLFGADPQASILAITALLSISQLTFAASLTRALRENKTFFALVAAFIASSPYQFIWSRGAWDNTLVEISVSFMVAILIGRAPNRSWRPLALGALLGVAVGAHLMVLSFVPVLIGFLATDFSASTKRRISAITIVVAVAALINVPYALALFRTHAHASSPGESASLGRVFSELLQPARISGLHGMQYFFDDAWSDFQDWAGDVGQLFDLFTFPLIIAVLSFAGLLNGLSATSRSARRIAFLALGTAVAHAWFLGFGGLSLHPHYQYPAWWVTVAGLVLFAAWLRASAPRLWNPFVVAFALLSATQFAFIVTMNAYLRDRVGTNGEHYSAPLAEQQRVLRNFCETIPRQSRLVNATNTVFSSTLRYIIDTDPACAASKISICDDPCDESDRFDHATRLEFARDEGGALVLIPDQGKK
ncbi:MAG: hypothetical protein ABI183_12250 [Polyangiaceae bacterium]